MRTVESVLAVPPRVQQFSGDGEQGYRELREALQSQSVTKPIPICDYCDILLNSRGLVQSRYRLTTLALQQICTALSPGLIDVVKSISGMKNRRGSALEKYSYNRAVGLLNWFIKFRFELLEGHSLIIDIHNRQVEGMVGPRHHFLSNADFLTRIGELLQHNGVGMPMSFHSASLAGRKLLVRFCSAEPAFTVPTRNDGQEPFHVGLHFSNAELGDGPVKATALLLRGQSRGVSLFPFDEKMRLWHLKGSRFDQRLHDVFMRAVGTLDAVADVRKEIIRATRRKLGLGGDAAKQKKRVKELRKMLTRSGIPKTAAEKALYQTMACGSYDADDLTRIGQHMLSVGSPDLLARLESRTVFDLCNAISLIANKLPPREQELAEQCAYCLLTGEMPSQRS